MKKYEEEFLLCLLKSVMAKNLMKRNTGCEFEVICNGKVIKATNDLAARSREILKQGGLAAYTRNGGN